MKTFSLLVLLGMVSFLRANPLSKCTEDDVCQAIVFNQLALAELQEEMTTILRNFNSSAIKGDSSKCESLRQKCMQNDQAWNQEKQTLQEDLGGLQTQVDDLESTNQLLQETVVEKEKSLDQSTNEAGRLKGINEHLESTNQGLSEANQQLQQAVVTQQNAVTRLTNEGDGLKRINKHLQTTVETLEEDNRNLQGKVEGLETQNHNLGTTEKPIEAIKPTDCVDVQALGETSSGKYTIYPYGNDVEFEVMCDMDSDDGGWTVFFARQESGAPVNFNEDWQHFKEGFGSLNTEFWLGNDLIHALSSRGPTTMRVDAESFKVGDSRWAEWNEFNVDGEDTKYLLTLEQYDERSTLGDSLASNSNNSFTTYDSDNDNLDEVNCAEGSAFANWAKGGWWYNQCGSARPTGPLMNTNNWDSACWYNWDPLVGKTTSIKKLSMKFKRHNQGQRQEQTQTNDLVPEIIQVSNPRSQPIEHIKPTDCVDVQALGETSSGKYTIYPYGNDVEFEVMCDMDSDDGGWTVFFARQESGDPVNFNEDWQHFKEGFGSLNTEFWLGNDLIHALTSRGPTTLRVDAESFKVGDSRWAEWNEFNVDGEDTKYLLTLEQYDERSTLGDSLASNSNNSFTTYDSDNDNLDEVNCAEGSAFANWAKGGWWYNQCGSARPTGPLMNTNNWDSACWYNWDPLVGKATSIKKLSMKFKRHNQGQEQTQNNDLVQQILQVVKPSR